jgi:hypothetical protein
MIDQSALARALQAGHWAEAAQHWHHYGPPLRPHASDIRAMEETVWRWRANHCARPPKALLWGVTPEIAAMAWPDGTELVAVDRSKPMIEHVWPGDVAGHRRTICSDWLEYSCGDEHYDIVIGDGTFTLMGYPQPFRALAAKAGEMLTSDGVLIIRHFMRPPKMETPEAVFGDLAANRIGNFHVFKFRLAMSLQKSADSGVRMGDVFSAWKGALIDLAALADMTGWTREVIETIRLYEGKDSRLSFPDAAEIDMVMREQFEKLDERYQPYEMGERCPIISYRRRE